ncbi:MAG: class I SAM-dependent methyltransferase [Candidatus Bathyarchaeota archaeon]|nr:class I SAM-dependent methyltransferase [Candidatus Bathyarchaeota archaeon]
MATYVLMRILESAPKRYDRGIRILKFGKLDLAYDRMMSYVEEEDKVLDLGCGTGALSLRAAKKGANVKGIDVNSQMLEIAKKRVVEANLTRNLELCEMGVAEIAKEKSESYDVVMAGLCFSELTKDELIYALKEVKRILKPEGFLLITDEVVPKTIFKRALNYLIRFPLVIITYLITQSITTPIKGLQELVKEEGLLVESIKLNEIENFIELVGKKSKE